MRAQPVLVNLRLAGSNETATAYDFESRPDLDLNTLWSDAVVSGQRLDTFGLLSNGDRAV
jgi:hypothetical protein